MAALLWPYQYMYRACSDELHKTATIQNGTKTENPNSLLRVNLNPSIGLTLHKNPTDRNVHTPRTFSLDNNAREPPLQIGR